MHQPGARVNCVVDGDTMWLQGEKVRIADIDTPEISQPKCALELALGIKATQRLIDLVNDGPFEFRHGPEEMRTGRAGSSGFSFVTDEALATSSFLKEARDRASRRGTA